MLLAIVVATSAIAEARAPLAHSPAIDVPFAPVVVNVGGVRRLVYELHLTNLRPHELVLSRIAVSEAATGAVYANDSDAGLAEKLGRPGIAPPLADARSIGGGLRAVWYAWIPLRDDAAAPRVLRHRIEYAFVRDGQRQAGMVDAFDVPVRSDAPVVLGPPLRGGPWVGLYDPALVGGHRTALYTIDGRARIPGRFAIDWVRVDASGNRLRGDPEQVASHLGFGADVLAVADARVADARDDMPDAASLAASRGQMALELASGNYVVLDIGDGRFAFYEHLKQGSLRVRTGDRVARGEVIASLGNTGSSSSGPHLHFHVADGEATLGAQGVPWVFDGFEQLGRYEDMDAAISGKVWPRGESGARLLELPGANAVVVFSEAERGEVD